MFLSRNKKNNVYPCKPQIYYVKVGFKWVKLYRHVFVMSRAETGLSYAPIHWPLQRPVAVHLCLCVCGFIFSVCVVRICYSSLRGGSGMTSEGVDLIKLSYLLCIFEQTGCANSVDPDQTPQNAASYQDLHYLPLIQQF